MPKEALKLPPFPPLIWDGWSWQGDCSLRVFWSKGTFQLTVRTNHAQERQPSRSAPPPSDSQTAAFKYLVDAADTVRASLLASFQKNLPELESSNWQGAEALLEIADVAVFEVNSEGVSYIGLVFNSMEYEHGIGIIMHRERVVHFGSAEEADEAAAAKDVRRLARKKSGSKPVE